MAMKARNLPVLGPQDARLVLIDRVALLRYDRPNQRQQIAHAALVASVVDQQRRRMRRIWCRARGCFVGGRRRGRIACGRDWSINVGGWVAPNVENAGAVAQQGLDALCPFQHPQL